MPRKSRLTSAIRQNAHRWAKNEVSTTRRARSLPTENQGAVGGVGRDEVVESENRWNMGIESWNGGRLVSTESFDAEKCRACRGVRVLLSYPRTSPIVVETSVMRAANVSHVGTVEE